MTTIAPSRTATASRVDHDAIVVTSDSDRTWLRESGWLGAFTVRSDRGLVCRGRPLPSSSTSTRPLRTYIADLVANRNWAQLGLLTSAGVTETSDDADFTTARARYGFAVESTLHLRNSTCSVLRRHSRRYFVKLRDYHTVPSELVGYLLFAVASITPKLCWLMPYRTGCALIFEYLPIMASGKGTLCDRLTAADRRGTVLAASETEPLAARLENNLSHRVRTRHSPIDCLFAGRTDSRIVPWYLSAPSKLLDAQMHINEGVTGLTTRLILAQVVEYFATDRLKTCALSQGDFNDLNIGLGPTFVDLTNAGYNDVWAEFACTFWSLYAGYQHLFPKYHPAAYQWRDKPSPLRSPASYRHDTQRPEITIHSSYLPGRASRHLLRRIMTVYDHTLGAEVFASDLAHYLIMRVAGVFDLRRFDTDDAMFCLAMIHRIWHRRHQLRELLDELTKDTP